MLIELIMKIYYIIAIISIYVICYSGCAKQEKMEVPIKCSYSLEDIHALTDFTKLNKGKALIQITSQLMACESDQAFIVDFKNGTISELFDNNKYFQGRWFANNPKSTSILSYDGYSVYLYNHHDEYSIIYNYNILSMKTREIVKLENAYILGVYEYDNEHIIVFRDHNSYENKLLFHGKIVIINNNYARNFVFSQTQGFLYAIQEDEIHSIVKINTNGDILNSYHSGYHCILSIALDRGGNNLYFLQRDSRRGGCVGKVRLYKMNLSTKNTELLDNDFRGTEIYYSDDESLVFVSGYNFSKGMYYSEVGYYSIVEKKNERLIRLLDYNIHLRRPNGGFSYIP